MSSHLKGISLDKVELISVLGEGVLYGFSLLLFGGTSWVLCSQRSIYLVNVKAFGVTCLLLLVSTAHFVIDVFRLWEAFILFPDAYSDGALGYFSNVSRWTFVCRFYVFTAQLLLADGIILYRCYVVWESKIIMLLPALLWCAVGVFGIGSSDIASRVKHSDDIVGSHKRLSQWITLFWASALATNMLTTILLACRIWYVDQKATKTYGPGKSQLRPMLHIIVDTGMICSIALLAALISFVCRFNFPYSMIAPIFPITFYMVIIRVGLSNRTKRLDQFETTDTVAFPMQVHIATLTERKLEDDRPLSTVLGVDERDDFRRMDKPGCVGELI